MDLYLVRHGQIAGGWWAWHLDPPIDTTGVEQALRAAERLARNGLPMAVYTSPMQRATLTARIIAQRLRVKPITDPDLREASASVILTLAWSLAMERIGAARLDHATSTALPSPSAEFQAFYDRVATTVDAIVDNHATTNAVVVSHAVTIRAALAHLLPDHARSCWNIHLGCGRLAHVRITDGTATLLATNV